MRAATVIMVAFSLALVGCGYVDDNPRAAAIVAQAYLDALAAHDAAAACRVLAPEVQLALASGQTCEVGLEPQLRNANPRLRVGRIRKVPGPPGNPRLDVDVPAQPGREIEVGRYGSIWRVIFGGATQPTEPAP